MASGRMTLTKMAWAQEVVVSCKSVMDAAGVDERGNRAWHGRTGQADMAWTFRAERRDKRPRHERNRHGHTELDVGASGMTWAHWAER